MRSGLARCASVGGEAVFAYVRAAQQDAEVLVQMGEKCTWRLLVSIRWSLPRGNLLLIGIRSICRLVQQQWRCPSVIQEVDGHRLVAAVGRG